jgi:adenosine deaminase
MAGGGFSQARGITPDSNDNRPAPNPLCIALPSTKCQGSHEQCRGPFGRVLTGQRSRFRFNRLFKATLQPRGGAALSDEGAKGFDPGDRVTDDWVRALPKAEVHVHLEGCFEVERIVELARAAGEPLPRPPDRLFEFPDLPSLLEFLDWACGLVRTRDQVERAAYAFAEREARSGVRYADLIFNPTHWPWRDSLGEFIDALDAGFTEAERDGLPKVGLCVSLLRQQSAAEAAELVEWLLERKPPRVVALSIDGNEGAVGRTGPRFADAFQRAAAGGMHRTVHAGESSGPDGVRDAIELLGAERIDHGIRAIEDPELVKRLAETGVPLDVCPGSNVALGLYPDLASHPIDALRRAGVRVSINTDDPAYLKTDLVTEYVATADAFDWDADVLRQVARTSIESSFADEDLKRSLLAELDALLD